MMKQFLKISALAAAVLFAPSVSAAPKVATDLPAVSALVSKVMAGVATPSQLLPPGASPHGYHMRPSEAAALAGADVLIWIGPALTPWLERSRLNLNPHAISLALLEAPGTVRHPSRGDAIFDKHDVHQKDDHADDHKDEHKDGHKDDHHDHGPIDPHAWLDTENGARWLGAIAKALSKADPENAGRYAANAAAGEAELRALTEGLHGMLAPVRDKPYVVLHDAFQYFEMRFRIPALGAIRLTDGAAPSPRRIAALRQGVKQQGARCVFREPQFSAALANSLAGPDIKTGVLDPVGWELSPGWTLYTGLLQKLGTSLRQCLE
jgi:zinc transport system substrate-binding protein